MTKNDQLGQSEMTSNDINLSAEQPVSLGHDTLERLGAEWDTTPYLKNAVMNLVEEVKG